MISVTVYRQQSLETAQWLPALVDHRRSWCSSNSGQATWYGKSSDRQGKQFRNTRATVLEREVRTRRGGCKNKNEVFLLSY